MASSKDIVLKARAMLLQFLKGDRNNVPSIDVKASKLQEKDAVFKILDNLKGTSSLDAKSELKIIFNTAF